jgi:general stress protein YciG
MAGSVAGGVKCAATNKKKYGENYYKKIGAIGGQIGTTGGFWANRELAKKAGSKGGRLSRREKSNLTPETISAIRRYSFIGMSMAAISRELEISYSIVRRIVRG